MENNSNYVQQNYNGNVGQPSYDQITPPKKKSSGGNAIKFIALAVSCSIAGGIIGAGSMCVVDTLKDAALSRIEQPKDNGKGNESGKVLEGTRDSKPLNINYVDTGKELTAAEIYAANVNSTVGIQTSIMTNYFGYQTMAAAAGSGFILSDDGYIITNYHVIEDAEEIKVTTYDDKTYDAKLVGCDEDNDLAVLKIDAEDLSPVILGDSDKMNVGDNVVAIGNPLGELTFSLTQGAVSALNRSITIGNMSMNLIQTDCAINSGNSGGALFNMKGEVIGITNAKYSSSGYTGEASIDNIGFAIPINSVKRIVASIVENGYIIKPYIGVSVSSMSEETASITGIKAGAWVREVTEGAPADKAGVKVNDVIVKVGDTEITSSEDLVAVVSSSDPGETLRFYLYRQGKELELDVTIDSKTESATKNEDEAAAAEKDPSANPQERQNQQPNPYNYNGEGDWGGNSMEDFFNYFFRYGY
ncbi:MAG: trypsin-like peptidase domain-containing protein [Clostridia bacterium]|nr:trypsin-like peptidase domain-containing protein [Clostridia bacterium]